MEDKKKKIMLVSVVVLLLVVVGATYAYFAAQMGNGARTNIDITAESVDSLLFKTGGPLSIEITQNNFAEGAGNKRSTSYAEATLVAGKDRTPSHNYFVYINVQNNTLKYTTKDKKAEVLLKVTDPDNNVVTSIQGLNYVTSGGESGFDITELNNSILIGTDTITTSSSITRRWNIEIVFVNLDTNQAGNAGKSLSAYLSVEQEMMHIATNYNGASGIPRAVGATASVSCDGVTAGYNPQYNRLEVTGFNKEKIACTLTYTDRTSKTYLNNKIIGLAGTTQGDGQVVNENGYRYEGKAPDNYIWFNNELWRIIGVFDSSSHGQSGQNLVKIIRNEAIGSFYIDDAYNNEHAPGNYWETMLMNLLLSPNSEQNESGSYYNRKDGTDTIFCNYILKVSGSCDFRRNGITDNYRSMIKFASWPVNRVNTVTANVDTIYSEERGTGLAEKDLLIANSYIGLMYASDYGYSALASSCPRTTNLKSYRDINCAGASWLYGSGEDWTLTPIVGDEEYNEDLIYVDYAGNAIEKSSGFLHLVRPVLYLDSSVYLISGTGSITDPYIIGM